MAGFLHRLQRFAKSPQGKKAMGEAERLAKDPKTRRQIDDVRRRLTGGGKATKRP